MRPRYSYITKLCLSTKSRRLNMCVHLRIELGTVNLGLTHACTTSRVYAVPMACVPCWHIPPGIRVRASATRFSFFYSYAARAVGKFDRQCSCRRRGSWPPSPFFRASGQHPCCCRRAPDQRPCCCRRESAALSASMWLSMPPDQSRRLEELVHSLCAAEATLAVVEVDNSVAVVRSRADGLVAAAEQPVAALARRYSRR